VFVEIICGLLGALIGAMLMHLYYDLKSSPESAQDKSVCYEPYETLDDIDDIDDIDEDDDWEFDEPMYDIELGIDEYLTTQNDHGVWVEVEIQNDCGYGCKIYEHSKTGRRALAHNSAYGCKRSFNLIKE
jgi:hypothetical protein